MKHSGGCIKLENNAAFSACGCEFRDNSASCLITATDFQCPILFHSNSLQHLGQKSKKPPNPDLGASGRRLSQIAILDNHRHSLLHDLEYLSGSNILLWPCAHGCRMSCGTNSIQLQQHGLHPVLHLIVTIAREIRDGRARLRQGQVQRRNLSRRWHWRVRAGGQDQACNQQEGGGLWWHWKSPWK